MKADRATRSLWIARHQFLAGARIAQDQTVESEGATLQTWWSTLRSAQRPNNLLKHRFPSIARVEPGFRCVFSLPHEPAHHVSSSRIPANYFVLHSERDCNESGTNGIARPYAVLVAQSQTEVRAPKRAPKVAKSSRSSDERFFVEARRYYVFSGKAV